MGMTVVLYLCYAVCPSPGQLRARINTCLSSAVAPHLAVYVRSASHATLWEVSEVMQGRLMPSPSTLAFRWLFSCLCAQGGCRKHQPRGCHIVVARAINESDCSGMHLFWVSFSGHFLYFFYFNPFLPMFGTNPSLRSIRCQSSPGQPIRFTANQALLPTADFGEWTGFPAAAHSTPSKVSPGTPNLVKRWSTVHPPTCPTCLTTSHPYHPSSSPSLLFLDFYRARRKHRRKDKEFFSDGIW